MMKGGGVINLRSEYGIAVLYPSGFRFLTPVHRDFHFPGPEFMPVLQ